MQACPVGMEEGCVAVKVFLLVGANLYQIHIAAPFISCHVCRAHAIKYVKIHMCQAHRNVEK